MLQPVPRRASAGVENVLRREGRARGVLCYHALRLRRRLLASHRLLDPCQLDLAVQLRLLVVRDPTIARERHGVRRTAGMPRAHAGPDPARHGIRGGPPYHN